ncbi:hypothetical protein A2Z22_00960 [Candidatus Woesebacteria bacterium RBG_16_34_12]|uniref:DinB-like domain-containing protein n=1 Tax=Candidatus Woesebacteria bacterium RBG_16_34_12 TaxID=1802480 RepID=A0A1F7XAQ4_9BACT|nr:MAG: hypothetical protein A2Z22_00960 [Candidatus Woesebacteria bacterium RBG_16_34_12]
MYTIADFKKVQKELLDAVQKFPKEKVDKKFYGDWTIKEVVGHISAWDKYFTEVLKNIIEGVKSEHWGNIDEFNEKEVAKRKSWNLEKLIGELVGAGKNFIKVYESLDKDLLTKRIWEKKKYTPEDILKIEIHHYKSQVNQIKKQS